MIQTYPRPRYNEVKLLMFTTKFKQLKILTYKNYVMYNDVRFNDNRKYKLIVMMSFQTNM
jgi:hypothetical protein